MKIRWWASRAELRGEAERWRERCEKSNAEKQRVHGRLKAQRKELNSLVHEQRCRADRAEARLARAMARLATMATEPARAEGCSKVRLHHRSEADSWAEQIANGTGSRVEDLEVYQCRSCPRSPVTMGRYWHVGHSLSGVAARVESKERYAAAQGRARAAGTQIAQRVDPQVLARLKEMGRS